MKQLLFTTFLFLLLITSSEAQSNYNPYYDLDVKILLNGPVYSWPPVHYQPPAGTHQIKTAVVKKKKTTVSVFNYNEKGQLVSYFKTEDKNKLNKRADLVYNDLEKISHVTFYKKGKTDYEVSYTYDSSSRLIALTRTNAGGSVKNKYEWTYNSTRQLQTSVYCEKGEKIKHRWEYEYIDSNKIAMTTLFNRKGKIKERWSYLCEAQGEQVKGQKQNNFCTTKEVKDDFIYITTNGTNTNGKTFRNVGKYDAKDSSILEWRYYNDKNELERFAEYDHSFDKKLKYVNYRKGKETLVNTFEYKGERLVYAVYRYKSKSGTTYSYTFSDTGWLMAYSVKDLNGKIKEQAQLTYE